MPSYSTRRAQTGRYSVPLLLLTLLYLLLMLPAAAGVSATWLLIAATPGASGPLLLGGGLGLIACATFPLVALIAIVGGWARYSQGRYRQAVALALWPAFNGALFLAGVLVARL